MQCMPAIRHTKSVVKFIRLVTCMRPSFLTTVRISMAVECGSEAAATSASRACISVTKDGTRAAATYRSKSAACTSCRYRLWLDRSWLHRQSISPTAWLDCRILSTAAAAALWRHRFNPVKAHHTSPLLQPMISNPRPFPVPFRLAISLLLAAVCRGLHPRLRVCFTPSWP